MYEIFTKYFYYSLRIFIKFIIRSRAYNIHKEKTLPGDVVFN